MPKQELIPMNVRPRITRYLGLAALLATVACGGGNDDSCENAITHSDECGVTLANSDCNDNGCSAKCINAASCSQITSWDNGNGTNQMGNPLAQCESKCNE
jgi:hypothetical protein